MPIRPDSMGFFYLNEISGGAAASKLLDLYGNRILKRDFEAGFTIYLNHFVKDLGLVVMFIGFSWVLLARRVVF